jgi:hypothetical protein
MITTFGVRPQAGTNFKSSISNSSVQRALRTIFYTVVQGIVRLKTSLTSLLISVILYLFSLRACSLVRLTKKTFPFRNNISLLIARITFLPYFYLFFISSPKILILDLSSLFLNSISFIYYVQINSLIRLALAVVVIIFCPRYF